MKVSKRVLQELKVLFLRHFTAAVSLAFFICCVKQ